MSGINWSKLVDQNRVKAPGIPWSVDEMKAIKDGISPDDVRLGLIKKEDVEEFDKNEALNGKKLIRMKKDELIELAKSLEIVFIEEDVTRPDLISVCANEIKRIKKVEEELETQKSKETTL